MTLLRRLAREQRGTMAVTVALMFVIATLILRGVPDRAAERR